MTTTRLPGIRAIAIAIGAALLIGLIFTAAPPANAAHGSSKLVLKRGVGTKGKRSVRVRAVQHALQRHGFRVHRADGRFGRSTVAAVRRFQRRAGLHVTGVVNAGTRRALGLTPRFNRARRRHRAAHHARHRPTTVHRAVVAPPRKAAPDPPGARASIASATSAVSGTARATSAPPSAAAPAVANDSLPGVWPLGAVLLAALAGVMWLVVRPSQTTVDRYRIPALAFAGAASLVDALPAGVPAGAITDPPPTPTPSEPSPATPTAGDDRADPDAAASNGGASNGAAPNDAASNGHAVNGAASNGASSNGHAVNGGASNGASSNGASSNGHAANGAASNGASSNGASSNGASSNGAASHTRASDDAASEGGPSNVAVAGAAPSASDVSDADLSDAAAAGAAASEEAPSARAAPDPEEPPAPSAALGAGAPVIAYVDTATSAGGRAARKIERTCARRGWDLLEVVAERGDRRTADRPGLAYALERIERGEARALVVRDVHDLGRRSVGRRACTRRLRLAGAALVMCVPGSEPVIDQHTSRIVGRRRAS